MQTKKLLKLSLIVTFIGIFVLMILNQNSDLKLTNINEITEKKLDQWVKVQGSLEQNQEIKTKTGIMTIFNIRDSTSSINVVYYGALNLTNELEVVGKVAEYKGEMEIIASKIKCLS